MRGDEKDAFYRYGIQESILADLSAFTDHAGLYP